MAAVTAAARRGAPARLRLLAAVRGEGRRISRGELFIGMPRTSRRPRSRGELMRAFHADPRLAGVRADFAGHLTATMRILSRWASWADSDPDPRATARPTRDRIAREAGYSLSTWKACRRVLEAWGWLLLIRAGRTEEFRRRSPREDWQYPGNDAAVYMLIIPRLPRWRPRKTAPGRRAASAPPVTRPPSQADAGAIHARGPVDGAGEGRTPLRGGSLPRPAHWLALQDDPVLRKLSERASERLWRPFGRRAWTVAQWRRAFDWRPDGSPHGRDGSGVRYPASWARWRLSHWLGPDGRPLPPPHMQAAVIRQSDRAAAARQRAADDAGRAAAAPPGAGYLAAREQLRGRSTPAGRAGNPQATERDLT